MLGERFGAPLLRLLALIAFSGGAAHAADSLYIVAKVTVDATAQDAVAAKAKGMEDAERNALNVVLKRLMPLSAYAQLPDLSSQDVEDLIEGRLDPERAELQYPLSREPRCQLQQPSGEAAARQPEHRL